MADIFSSPQSIGLPGQKPKSILPRWLKWLAGFTLLLLVIGIVAPGIVGSRGIKMAPENAALQTSRTLALAMFQYANDNNGQYPTGTSSTEVFQKLMDGNYIIDPAIFYVKMSGKVKGAANKLKPENVSWDVTMPVDSNSPDGLPLVFLTGYRIEYKAGGSAVPLSNSKTPFLTDGLAACYKSNSAWFKMSTLGQDVPKHSVKNFVPADFDAKGQKFQQLTPDGPLPEEQN